MPQTGGSRWNLVSILSTTWDIVIYTKHCIGLKMAKCGAAVKRGYKTGNRNRKLTKLIKIVSFEFEITLANFGGDRTTFVKVMAKKLMHPSSWTRAWLPSFLILRGLWPHETSGSHLDSFISLDLRLPPRPPYFGRSKTWCQGFLTQWWICERSTGC